MFSHNDKINLYLKQHRELYGNNLYLLKNEFTQQNRLDSLYKYYLSIKDCLECSLGNTRTNFV